MALLYALRLRRARDIQRVFKRSFRLETASLVIRVHKKESLPGRAVVIVPKKVSRKAVLRNRLRRRVAEWVRVHLRLKTKPLDIVFSLKPGAVVLSREVLQKELQEAAGRIHL